MVLRARVGRRPTRPQEAAGARIDPNPSEAWAELTGLPFVFAPWIVREGVDLAPHAAAFARASERGRAKKDDLAKSGYLVQRFDLKGKYLMEYKSEYKFKKGTWAASVEPEKNVASGYRSFFVDQSGVIRYNAEGQKADEESPPLE